MKENMVKCHCGNKVYSPYGHTVYCRVCVAHNVFTSCFVCKEDKDLLFISGRYICLECFEKDKKTCAHCKKFAPFSLGYSDQNNFYCRDCYLEYYSRCYTCRNIVKKSKVKGFHYNQYCSDCIPLGGNYIRSDSFSCIKSERFYGIEIECEYSEYSPDDLWEEKGEHCGSEFVSPLLQGDYGLDIIKQFYFDAEPYFNDDCGLHVHVDIRDFTDQQLIDLIKALKDTKNTWYTYTDPLRWDNEYCCYDIPDVRWCDNWSSYCERESFPRYAWVNLRSIWTHGSIEFRLHEATDNPNKVVGWVMMIVNFVSEVKEMSNV